MSAMLASAPHMPDAMYSADSHMYVTMRVDNQLFGIGVKHVRDVLRPQKVTAIPLALKEISGSLNLRGRIVTVVDMRTRLGLPPNADDSKKMFVVVDLKGELYSLKVDTVGEVLTVSGAAIEKPPAHLDPRWHEVATGIHKLEGELLVIINVQTVLTL